LSWTTKDRINPYAAEEDRTREQRLSIDDGKDVMRRRMEEGRPGERVLNGPDYLPTTNPESTNQRELFLIISNSTKFD